MKVIEKSQSIKTNDIIVIEDESLKMKWFIDIEQTGGKITNIKESVNYQYFMMQGLEYINKVYALAIQEIVIKKDLDTIILEAEEKKSIAGSKYDQNKNLASIMAYYMDLSNAFNELIEQLKIIK